MLRCERPEETRSSLDASKGEDLSLTGLGEMRKVRSWCACDQSTGYSVTTDDMRATSLRNKHSQ